MASITRAVADVDDPASFAGRARARRWSELLRRFPDLGAMAVLDLGGTAGWWAGAPARPERLVLLNTFDQSPPWEGAQARVGDACLAGHELRAERFDLVVSNSVIGHLGGPARRAQFAASVSALGDHHWIQTPYRYFPLEPCSVFPGLQFLPVSGRAAVARHWPLGHRRATTRWEAVEMAISVELLSRTEFRHYFPDSEIWTERMCGLVKSLVAVR